jgi:hypothetical protein
MDKYNEYVKRGWPPRVAAIYSGIVAYTQKVECKIHSISNFLFENGKVTVVDNYRNIDIRLKTEVPKS